MSVLFQPHHSYVLRRAKSRSKKFQVESIDFQIIGAEGMEIGVVMVPNDSPMGLVVGDLVRAEGPEDGLVWFCRVSHVEHFPQGTQGEVQTGATLRSENVSVQMEEVRWDLKQMKTARMAGPPDPFKEDIEREARRRLGTLDDLL